MTVEVKPVLPEQKIATQDGMPTIDLIEIIQRLVSAVEDLETRVTALEP